MPFITINYEKLGSPIDEHFKIELVLDRWDDWRSYRTQFYLVVTNKNTGEKIDIGNVKIGQKGLLPSGKAEEGKKRAPFLESSFEQLSDDYFSIGQDQTYYEELMNLPNDLGVYILKSLNDICYNPALQEKFSEEDVMGESLLRSVSWRAIEKFTRIINGNAELTKFNFEYHIDEKDDLTKLDFNVTPNSFPPSNVHILIGRNGVGKSHNLRKIAGIYEGKKEDLDVSAIIEVSTIPDALTKKSIFSKVLHVIFSIFDDNDEYCINTPFKEIIGIVKVREKKSKTNPQSVINKPSKTDANSSIKSKRDLAEEFIESITKCLSGVRRKRLESIFKIFEYDETLKKLAAEIQDEKVRLKYLRKEFCALSSGHAAVLLTIVQLVEKVEERTLILLDEPESHLHPPLLSAYIRAVSSLAQMRNAVVVCATHSPIVLQEVPKSCVWKISRFGPSSFKAERPYIETFGENLGTLTSEIFGYEVEQSGFHKLLNDKVLAGENYDEILKELKEQLGFEGKLLLSNMIANKESL